MGRLGLLLVSIFISCWTYLHLCTQRVSIRLAASVLFPSTRSAFSHSHDARLNVVPAWLAAIIKLHLNPPCCQINRERCRYWITDLWYSLIQEDKYLIFIRLETLQKYKCWACNVNLSLFIYSHTFNITVWRLQPAGEVTERTTDRGCRTSCCFICRQAERVCWCSTCRHMSAVITSTEIIWKLHEGIKDGRLLAASEW